MFIVDQDMRSSGSWREDGEGDSWQQWQSTKSICADDQRSVAEICYQSGCNTLIVRKDLLLLTMLPQLWSIIRLISNLQSPEVSNRLMTSPFSTLTNCTNYSLITFTYHRGHHLSRAIHPSRASFNSLSCCRRE